MSWSFYLFSRCYNHYFIETPYERSTRLLSRLALCNSNSTAE
jgi:hypothetical protein